MVHYKIKGWMLDSCSLEACIVVFYKRGVFVSAKKVRCCIATDICILCMHHQLWLKNKGVLGNCLLH